MRRGEDWGEFLVSFGDWGWGRKSAWLGEGGSELREFDW